MLYIHEISATRILDGLWYNSETIDGYCGRPLISWTPDKRHSQYHSPNFVGLVVESVIYDFLYLPLLTFAYPWSGHWLVGWRTGSYVLHVRVAHVAGHR